MSTSSSDLVLPDRPGCKCLKNSGGAAATASHRPHRACRYPSRWRLDAGADDYLTKRFRSRNWRPGSGPPALAREPAGAQAGPLTLDLVGTACLWVTRNQPLGRELALLAVFVAIRTLLHGRSCCRWCGRWTSTWVQRRGSVRRRLRRKLGAELIETVRASDTGSLRRRHHRDGPPHDRRESGLAVLLLRCHPRGEELGPAVSNDERFSMSRFTWGLRHRGRDTATLRPAGPRDGTEVQVDGLSPIAGRRVPTRQ